MKKYLLLLLILPALISCEQESQPLGENSDVMLLHKVLFSSELYMEYTYDNTNLLLEEKSKFTYTKHSYNDNNLLSSSEFYLDPGMFSSDSRIVEASMNRKEWVSPENTAKSLTQSFEYGEKGRLLRKTYIRPSATGTEYSEFVFDNDRIVRQMQYSRNTMQGYIEYEYDENGNLHKESRFYVPSGGSPELQTTTEYEYDNMNNPFRAFSCLMTPGENTNPNNITKETYTLHIEVDQFTQKVQVTNNTYTYNNKGYPVKVNGEAEYVYY
jgi:hypothetical protein